MSKDKRRPFAMCQGGTSKIMRPALLGVWLACLSGTAEGATIRVSLIGDGSDPSTWTGAYSSVASAIEFATAGDEIWVASGRYNESLQLKDRIALFGGFAGLSDSDRFESRDWRVYETILDASGFNDRVLVGADQATLDGLTITGGKRARNPLMDGGSGLTCRNFSMSIRNCFFHDNGQAGGLDRPEPASGGAIFCTDSDLLIERCVFLNNIGYVGGAISVSFETSPSSVFLINCLIDHNSSPAIAGSGGNGAMINCTFGNFNPTYSPTLAPGSTALLLSV